MEFEQFHLFIALTIGNGISGEKIFEFQNTDIHRF